MRSSHAAISSASKAKLQVKSNIRLNRTKITLLKRARSVQTQTKKKHQSREQRTVFQFLFRRRFAATGCVHPVRKSTLDIRRLRWTAAIGGLWTLWDGGLSLSWISLALCRSRLQTLFRRSCTSDFVRSVVVHVRRSWRSHTSLHRLHRLKHPPLSLITVYCWSATKCHG